MEEITNNIWDNKICKATKTERDEIIKNLIIAIDTREKDPLNFKFKDYELQTVRATLKFGDYTCFYPNLRDEVCIERKSLQDFIQCCTHERERFEKELIAMRGYDIKFILCEFNIPDIIEYLNENNKGSLINAILNSAIGFYEHYCIPCIFAGNRNLASRYIAETLIFRIKKIHYYMRTIYDNISINTTEKRQMS